MDSEEVAFREMFPMVIGGLVALTLVLIIIGVALSDHEDVYVPSGMTRADVLAERTQPIGQVQMGGPETVAAAEPDEEEADEPRSGDVVYAAACAACHDTGAAGSPLLDDLGEWQDRLDERGYDAVYQNALEGIGAMPARGGADISDDELRAAVDYILDEAGADY